MKKLALICSLLFIVGCTTRYSGNDMAPPAANSLERSMIIYVVTPEDGSYGNKVYPGSGTKIATILRNALTPYAKKVIIGPIQDEDEYLASAKEKGARYIFVPEITNWVHRMAAWSGRSSGVTLNVKIIDTSVPADEQVIAHRELRVQGRNITFKSQYPEDIAKPLIENYIKEIF